jgi:deoxyribodipyrimidine photo-lyase
MSTENPITLFWHRRDLRTEDNVGLFHALSQSNKVLPLFIFDTDILEKLEDKTDARVSFIHEQVLRIKKEYEQHGGSLLIEIGRPLDVFQKLVKQYAIHSIHTNRDYEPYALKRDTGLQSFFQEIGIDFQTHKDHVVFETNEVIKKDGTPYTIYTPYMRAWKERLKNNPIKHLSSETKLSQLWPIAPLKTPTLQEIGFEPTSITWPTALVSEKVIKQYDETRNYPALDGTSRLGVHFRFGSISIRQKVQRALGLNETYLNELIWREFYQMIIYHFPHSAKNSFKKKYDAIEWINDEKQFERWCKGETGYPIVDAGMRELNATGHMHNRVRMIVASFLTKHLLIDWRWGEAYFASKLLDYELASNVGGWQWAAGCGCDAAPYFRVFNPTLQTNKFDPQAVYIKKWVKEYGTAQYPSPIVEHAFARNRVLDVFKKALI